jgi:serine/threonine protein kinase
MSDLSVGSTIAGCRLDAVAGRGGMGVVYQATQLALGRPVALKAMAPQLAADESYRERFTRESHLAASIDHPNVIPVYEAGESDGTLYLIMRWVEGTDLRALLTESGRLEPPKAVRLLRPVASALAAAHRRGLVHRDIKPANVLIAQSEDEEDEHVYLTDFGIAKRTDTQGGMTRTGVLVGTIDYTSPERIEGGRGTPASDIYAFGCMLYETLTGHVPYERTTELLKMYAHMNERVPSARDEVAGVPMELDAVIAKAMAKRPEDRFATASELAAALNRSLGNGAAPTAPGTTPPAVELEPPTERQTVIATPAQTPAPALPPTPTPIEPPTVRAPRNDQPPAVVAERPATAIPKPPTQPPPASPPSRSRRGLFTTLAAVAVGAIAAVVIATSAGGGNGGGGGGGGASGAPSGITADSRGDVWVSYGSGTLTRIDPTGNRRSFDVGGKPDLVSGGSSGVWISDGEKLTLRDSNGNAVKAVGLARAPVALAASLDDGSVWAAEPDGTIAHATPTGQLEASAAKVTGTPRGLSLGAGWLWAVSGDSLIRIGLGGSHPVSAHDPGGQQPVAVTSDRGIWIAHAGGTISRFDPRPTKMGINTRQQITSALTGITAADGGPYVWATSQSGLYKLAADGNGTGTEVARFTSPPVGVAVLSGSVWVATQDGKLSQIRF